ncbi:glycoside hydrolase family 5 [Microbulbifer sp.]|uniref:glycoside hydrolase family 5 n=1 Tax=Microbulbifer sp. TaxID=1908541 RepID=UPI003F389AD8
MYSVFDRYIKKIILLSLSTLLVASCGGGSGSGGSSPPTPQPEPDPPPDELKITIDSQQRYQEIAGFGAALPMWTSNMLTVSEVRTLVGIGERELGLSILRTMIDPDPDLWSRGVDNLVEAKVYGDTVKVLATPWSPPAYMKDNDSTIGGGRLLLDYYDDYARHLNDYVAYMSSLGIVIDVVSVQNEPDWHPDYDSCEWSGKELRDFVRDHGSVVQADLLVGESLRFDRAYTDPSLNDTAALEQFEFVGGHLYGAEDSGTFTPYPLAEEKNKQRWMTEWLIHDADGDGAAIWGGADPDVWDETLDEVLGSVHKSMDVNWNAYIWWWARRFYSLIGDGEAAYGTVKGDVLKRGWAFSHYAKFVRPGYVRIGASVDQSDVYITAYEGENEIVAVVLNRSERNLEDVDLEMTESIQAADAFVTSITDDRAPLDIVVEGGQVQLPDLPARSVVTIVLSIE